ncbi:integrase family protein [Massilia agilis]|uniref:Integrase family protein n=1 Tax=Massilia agilis TaxID=1811226 RepID=A0ABT2D6W6_9BURK|nr:integrase family protein [Massilia agilis]MCS0807054.1 integrase family protein [Massilia agilis]
MEDDRQLMRVQRLYPELEEWRTYAAQWYGIVEGNFAIACAGINRFINYLAKNQLFPRPADYFLRKNAKLIPSFFECECAQSDHGAAMNNCVADFLDWVLIQPEFADLDEDSPTTLPIFRSPLNRVNRAEHRPRRGSESNKQVMPYWMIHDLRRRVAQGPYFRDWVWAQGLAGKANVFGDKESSDLFPADEARLDKSDRDCVWRIRQRIDKGSVLEMWSPVRWVACLLKLQITARMGQIWTRLPSTMHS